ncbi:[2Fe-2S] ferredoxin [Giardia muris]|uniref:[2Fe-2S] ferredoxin n=1 Tax=Giardia muris TaxID=5742 RepID=A0A4Z1TCC8_GIAMU|nr:[2Fe-2S] ferredoxin [Giardia muris]|eukprot:TNJ30229.1 [2Fe-2S] ferredoxin [Giardia muris]
MQDSVKFTVVADGASRTVVGAAGRSLLDVLKTAQVPIQDACEGHRGCGTCSVYLDGKSFRAVEPAEDDEEALLDGAPHRKPTSRLACALTLDKRLEGATVRIPPYNKNVLSESDILARSSQK